MDTLWNGDRYGSGALKRAEVFIQALGETLSDGFDINWFAVS